RKASGPAYLLGRGRASRIEARQLVGAPFGAPPPSLGSKDILGSKDMASRPFEASFFGKRERRPGCYSHRGNAVPRRHRRTCGGDERVRRCLTLWTRTRSLFSAPAIAGEGTTGARVASEPWWRGRVTRSFVAGAKK